MDRRIDLESANAFSSLETRAIPNCSVPNHPGNIPKSGCLEKSCTDHQEQHTLGEAVIEIGWHRQPDDAHLAGLLLQLIGEIELKRILNEIPGN